MRLSADVQILSANVGSGRCLSLDVSEYGYLHSQEPAIQDWRWVDQRGRHRDRWSVTGALFRELVLPTLKRPAAA